MLRLNDNLQLDSDNKVFIFKIYGSTDALYKFKRALNHSDTREIASHFKATHKLELNFPNIEHIGLDNLKGLESFIKDAKYAHCIWTHSSYRLPLNIDAIKTELENRRIARNTRVKQNRALDAFLKDAKTHKKIVIELSPYRTSLIFRSLSLESDCLEKVRALKQIDAILENKAKILRPIEKYEIETVYMVRALKYMGHARREKLKALNILDAEFFESFNRSENEDLLLDENASQDETENSEAF